MCYCVSNMQCYMLNIFLKFLSYYLKLRLCGSTMFCRDAEPPSSVQMQRQNLDIEVMMISCSQDMQRQNLDRSDDIMFSGYAKAEFRHRSDDIMQRWNLDIEALQPILVLACEEIVSPNS
jgi:hypothetical protein